MAGTVMHLVVADRLMDFMKIENQAYFYCGNLAPDAIMARKNYERDMKRHTHFKDGIRLHEFRQPDKMNIYMERLMEFFHKYVEREDAHHEIYLGYLTHMLVDELYILHFRDRFVDRLIAEGREPVDMSFWDLFTHDVDQVDLELVGSYGFRQKLPDYLRISEEYEIEDYITSEEILDSKEFIINKNFTKWHVPEELYVMTLENNLEFIELCVKEIPVILSERFGLSGLLK